MRVIVLTITPWAGSRYSRRQGDEEAQRRTWELNEWLLGQATEDGSVTVVDLSPLGEGFPLRLLRQYDGGDKVHPNDAGRELMSRLIAQAAYPEVTDLPEVPTPEADAGRSDQRRRSDASARDAGGQAPRDVSQAERDAGTPVTRDVGAPAEQDRRRTLR